MTETTTSTSSEGLRGTRRLVDLKHLGPDMSFVSRIIGSFYMPPHEHGLRLLDKLASSHLELMEAEAPSDAFSVMVRRAYKLADASATAGATHLSARAKEFAEAPTAEGLRELSQVFQATRAELVRDGVLARAGGSASSASAAAPAVGWETR